MTDAPPRQRRSAAVGTTILLLLGIAMGIAVGFGLTKLVEAAQLEDLAHQFRAPAAAPAAGVASLQT